jgi:uncharacterized membrane protein YdjX (TVP38/TMEM64 family)
MNDIEKEPTTNQAPRWIIRAIAALIILLVLWLNRHQLLTLLNLLRDREAVATYLEPLGIWGPLLLLSILGVQVVTIIMPNHALLITAGYLYGFSRGLTLNVIGVVIVSQLVFVMARQAGKPFMERLVPVNILDRWDNIAKRQGFFFFLICFWFPIIPSNATNYLAGLSSIAFWPFFLANLLGRLPGLALVTLIGSHGVEFSWQQWLAILPITLGIVVGGRYLATRIDRRFNSV